MTFVPPLALATRRPTARNQRRQWRKLPGAYRRGILTAILDHQLAEIEAEEKMARRRAWVRPVVLGIAAAWIVALALAWLFS